MNIKKSKLTFLLLALMLGQILIGCFWMIKNILALPIFGDSTEYLTLSQTFALDEYRPVLYPFILCGIQYFGKVLHIPYQVLLYLLQMVVSFGAISFGISTLDMMMCEDKNITCKNWQCRCFISLYIMTIPMISFMNFCILTDFFTTSMLIRAC